MPDPGPGPARPSTALRLLVDNAEELVATLMLVVMLVVMTLEIVMRSVFSQPLGWPAELSGLLLVWMSLLGSVGAIKRADHVRVDLLLGRLSGPGRRVAEVLIYLLVTGLLVMVLVVGWRVAASATYTAISLPISWKVVYGALPTFAVLGIVRLFQLVVLRRRFFHIEQMIDVSP